MQDTPTDGYNHRTTPHSGYTANTATITRPASNRAKNDSILTKPDRVLTNYRNSSTSSTNAPAADTDEEDSTYNPTDSSSSMSDLQLTNGANTDSSSASMIDLQPDIDTDDINMDTDSADTIPSPWPPADSVPSIPKTRVYYTDSEWDSALWTPVTA